MLLCLEPCADVIVSAAARGSILVGGAPPVQKNRRRRRGVGGKFFLKDSRKNFVLSSTFPCDLYFSHLKMQKNKLVHSKNATNYRRRRADQQNSAAAAPTNCRLRRAAPGAQLYLCSSVLYPISKAPRCEVNVEIVDNWRGSLLDPGTAAKRRQPPPLGSETAKTAKLSAPNC